VKLLRVLLGLGYPFLIFAGLQLLAPREIALGLAGLLVVRGLLTWRRPTGDELKRLAVPAALVAGVLVPTLLLDDAAWLLLVPVAMNLALLVAFARTLWNGPPLVETFALLQVPDLPPDEVRYCRSVTRVWCVFFAINAAVCLGLALFAELGTWVLYTGLVSYVLVGVLYSVEFVVRSWRFGRYEGALVEPLFRRIFPAHRRHRAGGPR
jgi:uncharacterized membrane protein